MDEDIRFSLSILGGTGAATDRYWQVPYKSTFRDLLGTFSADPGDDETVTVVNVTQTKTLGVLTFGSGISVGAKGVWAADSTDGNTVNAAGDVLKFTVTQLTAASEVELLIELDPKARIP